MGYQPQYAGSALKLYIGTWGSAKAVAGSTSLTLALFPTLPGQTAPIVFTPADVGNPIFIGGGGSVDPLTPAWYYTQGGPFHTTIAAYVSATEVMLVAAPETSYYNTGVNNITLYRPCQMVIDSVQFQSSISPGTRDSLQFATLQEFVTGDNYVLENESLNLGQPVYLTSADPDVGDIFGGLIDSIVVSNQMQSSGGGTLSIGSGLSAATNAAGENVFAFSVTCASWDQISTRRVVQPERATSYQDTDAGIVFNLLVVTHLNDESVAFENDIPPVSISPFVSGLPVIGFAVPAGAYVADLLNQLVSQITTPDATYYWYTDEWKTIHLSERAVTAAPWQVEDSNGSDSNVLVSVSAAASHNLLANDAYVIATEMLSISFVTDFIGDNTSTSFNVSNPVQAPPSITLNGGDQTVGVLNIDTGVQWYWSQGSTAITQGTGSILTPSDTLQVAYQSSTPGVGVAFNNTGLTAIEATEGMGALYQSSTTYSKPVSQADLLNYAQALANINGIVPVILSLTTLRGGLKTGQVQTITLADLGQFNGQYLISALNMTTTDNVISWNYTAVDGSNIGGWWTGWTNFINRGQNDLLIATATQPVVTAENVITIHHSMVVGSDKTNYVFGFLGTYAFLKQVPSGFVQYPNGSDIYFSLTADTGGLLDFDLSYYDPTTGQIAAWVRIPTLSASVDTTIYIMYGSVTQLVSLANPPGVWSPVIDVSGTPNPNYHGVYHLNETAGTYADSSHYGNNGTATAGVPTRVTGPFGNAQYANNLAAPAYITLPALTLGNGFSNQDATLECWINTTFAVGLNYHYDIFTAHSGSYGWGVALAVNNVSGHTDAHAEGAWQTNYALDVAQIVSDGNWHKLVFVVDHTIPDGKLYVDGVYKVDTGNAGVTAFSGPCYLFHSVQSGDFTDYSGGIAEARCMQMPKDADTIATEWSNQNSPDTFYSISTGSIGPSNPTVHTTGNPVGTVTNPSGPLTAGYPLLGGGGTAVEVGVPGQLVPAGGTSGQFLEKASGADYDTEWGTPAGTGTVTHTAGALSSNEPVFGNGGADIKVGTATGNTTQVQLASGSAGSAGTPLLYDASGNAVAGTRQGNATKYQAASGSPTTGAPLLYDSNGNAISGATGQLVIAGGTTGQALVKASGTDFNTQWATPSGSSPLTTKGDLYGYSTVNARIPVGTDTYVLTADSTQALGLKWAAGGGGGGGGGGTITFGLIGSLPGTPPSSGLYVCSDSPYVFVSDGTNWHANGFGFPCVQPPTLSNWTQRNFGTSSVSFFGGYPTLYWQSSGGDLFRGYTITKPGVSYTIIAGIKQSNKGAAGLGIYDSSSGKSISFIWGTDNYIHVFLWASGWGGISSVFQSSYNWSASPEITWFKIVEDATHRTYFVSLDGVTWLQMLQEAAGAHFTPTDVGLGTDVNGIAPLGWAVFSFAATSP